MKDYLGSENARNKRYAPLYTAMIQKALGSATDVLIGHHLCFEKHGDLRTENEIPSADTLIFDHEIMHACFGHNAHEIMGQLAIRDIEDRDAYLEVQFQLHHEDAIVREV